MLNLILVEAALETVPPSVQSHPSVLKSAKRKGKKPDEILLDRTLHHSAMKNLSNAHKKGRPDIVHFCLLEALGSPLNIEGGLRIWVNTVEGFTIDVEPETRLPRDCNRFNSLMEQLFKSARIPPESPNPLLTIRRRSLPELLNVIRPTRTIALTSHGKPIDLSDLCAILSEEENPVVLVGAYPSGPMGERTLSLADEALSIYPKALEAWVVTSRLIYEFEKARK